MKILICRSCEMNFKKFKERFNIDAIYRFFQFCNFDFNRNHFFTLDLIVLLKVSNNRNSKRLRSKFSKLFLTNEFLRNFGDFFTVSCFSEKTVINDQSKK